MIDDKNPAERDDISKTDKETLTNVDEEPD